MKNVHLILGLFAVQINSMVFGMYIIKGPMWLAAVIGFFLLLLSINLGISAAKCHLQALDDDRKTRDRFGGAA